MGKFGWFLIALLLVPNLIAKTVVLPELTAPEEIRIEGNKIFVVEGIQVFIYSLKDFAFIAKFGRVGEGPKEFLRSSAPWLPSIFLYTTPQHLFINSMNKISLFSHKGEFQREDKPQSKRGMFPFVPVGKNHIRFDGVNESNVAYYALILMDSQYKKIKEIFRFKAHQQNGKKLDPIVMSTIKDWFYRHIHKDILYFPTLDGVIHVFDSTGQETLTIKPPYQPIPITKSLAKKYEDHFLADIRFKMIYKADRARIEYGTHLPPMQAYAIDSNKIYIITPHKISKGHKTFIYSIKGKLLKTIHLPLKLQDILTIYPFTIHNNTIYQLTETEDEECQLTTTPIKG